MGIIQKRNYRLGKVLPAIASCIIPLVLMSCAASHSPTPITEITDTPMSITKEDLKTLKSAQEILAIHYPPPSLNTSEGHGSFRFGDHAGIRHGDPLGTFGALLLGPFGVGLTQLADRQADESKFAQETKVRQTLAELDVVDPTSHIKNIFLVVLKTKSGITNIRSVAQPVSNDELIGLYQKIGPGILMDFDTTFWGLEKGESDKYKVRYELTAKFKRPAEKTIIWKGVCRFLSRDAETLEELSANSGALLKKYLNEATDTCAEQLASQFVGKD